MSESDKCEADEPHLEENEGWRHATLDLLIGPVSSSTLDRLPLFFFSFVFFIIDALSRVSLRTLLSFGTAVSLRALASLALDKVSRTKETLKSIQSLH